MKKLFGKFLLLSSIVLGIISPAYSQTSVTRYVDCGCANNGDGTTTSCAGSPGGAGPYNSYANWETGEAADITSATGSNEIHTVIQVNGSGTNACLGPDITSASWTTNDTNRIIFDTLEADRHNGTFDSAKPHFATNDSWAIEADACVTIRNTQCYHESGFLGRGCFHIDGEVSGCENHVYNNVATVNAITTTNNQQAFRSETQTGTTFFYNNFCLDWDNDSEVDTGQTCFSGGTNSRTYVYHNTCFNAGKCISFSSIESGVLSVQNNIANDCEDAACISISGGGASGDYNITDDTSGPGANAVDNEDITFVSATDLHIDPSETNAQVANNLFSDSNLPVTDDIDGDARPSSGSVYAGADEIVGGGGGSSINTQVSSQIGGHIGGLLSKGVQ